MTAADNGYFGNVNQNKESEESPEIVGIHSNGKRVYLSCHRHSPGPRTLPLSESSEDNLTIWPLVDADDFCGEGETLESLAEKEAQKRG